MPTKYENFPKAPITEAIIDLRTTQAAAIDAAVLEPIAAKLSDKFPNKEERITHTQIFQVGPEAKPITEEPRKQFAGYVLRTAKRDWSVNLRPDGLGISKLKPYTRWDDLLTTAQEVWSLYVEQVKPRSVIRLGTRYINRIELPLPIGEFTDYVLTQPDIADGIPQGVAEFFFRVVIPKPDTDIRAAITSTLDKVDADRSILPYIFDIDVFETVDYQPNSKQIWADFVALREYKNLIFFNSTTEKAKDLFR